MTNQEFASLAKQLLPILPGFRIRAHLVFASPIAHTLKGLLFEGSSFDKRAFYVNIFFLPLCVPGTVISLNLGKRLGGGAHRWQSDDPKLVAQLAAAIRAEALPLFASLAEPRDVAEAARLLKGRSDDPYVHQAIAYTLAQAREFHASKNVLDHLLTLLNPEVRWQREMADRAKGLKEQLTNNPDAALEKLTSWEVETAKKLGLSEFYIKTREEE